MELKIEINQAIKDAQIRIAASDQCSHLWKEQEEARIAFMKKESSFKEFQLSEHLYQAYSLAKDLGNESFIKKIEIIANEAHVVWNNIQKDLPEWKNWKEKNDIYAANFKARFLNLKELQKEHKEI
jgi:hypothetical protein